MIKIKRLVICGFGVFVGAAACAMSGGTGTEQVEALKSRYWQSSDTDWVNWVTVSMAPTRIYMPSWSDERRQQLFDDFDPDFMDMWSGAAMDRGNFFRMRGTAVNHPMEYEYQEAINPVAHYGWALFRDNGIARKEDGKVAPRPFTPQFTAQCMCNLAPKWEQTVRQGVVRPGVFADALFQDNIANSIYTWGHGFCDWCNAKFVRFMKNRFSAEELKRMAFDPETFKITKYISEQRKRYEAGLTGGGQQVLQEQDVNGTANEQLLEDPVLREYIRFQHIENMKLVVGKADAMKRTAAALGRPVPAFYGNIPRINGLRAFPTIMASQVDIPWTEVSTDFQPPFYAGRQAWSPLLYKVGRAVAGYSKPVFSVQYHGGAHRDYSADMKYPIALPLAEAHANGGVPCQTWVATEFKYLMNREDWDRNLYDVNGAHARFVGKNRVLFTDRKQLARVALVHSLTSTFWRQFQSLTVPRKHLPHFTAAARLLEDSHVPYEILPFGHPDIFDDSSALARLKHYETIIIPEADCVSDAQAEAISAWVRKGGNLILWGEVGTRTEEMVRRANPVFEPLIRKPGEGTVRVIDSLTASRYVNGEIILPTSKDEPQIWEYAFETNGANAAEWMSGPAPFGSKEVRGVMPATMWDSDGIFLRREFELSAGNLADGEILLDMIHWWDAEVYINGVSAAEVSGRGRIFDAYQLVDISPAAQAALKPGKNVMTVHCRTDEKHASWGQIIDVGLVKFSSGKAVADGMQLSGALVETDLPPSTWLNVWQHGTGPMTSVQLVNYEIDLKTDKVSPVKNFKIRLQVPDASRIAMVYWFAADYTAYDSPAPEALDLRKGDGWVEVTVPRLDLFGVLVFSADQELAARTLAAEARKAFERLRISQRCLEDSEPLMNAVTERRVRNRLEQIQGDAAVSDFITLVPEMLALVRQLNGWLEQTMQSVAGQRDTARTETLNAAAVYKFDFGTETAPDGWTAVTPQSVYGANIGYGWTVNKDVVAVDREMPDALHGDFIRNINPADSNWAGKTKNRIFPFVNPPHRPGEFRVDLTNGTYRVTVITGDYSEMNPGPGTANEGRVAMTDVHANGKRVLIGDALYTGRFDNRTFETEVADGHLTLSFSGSNVGPLYVNTVEWLVNGLLIQKMDQQPTRKAQQSLEINRMIQQIAIRDWQVLGPFADDDFNGMHKEFGPERAAEPGTEWQGRDGIVRWQAWTQEDSEEMPYVPLGELFGTVDGAAAFARTCVTVKEETDALLHVSMNQIGEVYFNGEKIYRDEYAAGLLPREARLPVKLKAGENTVLLKSLHHWGDEWALWAGLSTPDGEPVK